MNKSQIETAKTWALNGSCSGESQVVVESDKEKYLLGHLMELIVYLKG